jgi:hypothetical protein
MRREYAAEAPQTMVAGRRLMPTRAGTTAATMPSRYVRCQCSSATATHDAQKLDELAPRLGGNHDAQDENRQADRHCTSHSVAVRKVHSRVRHFGGSCRNGGELAADDRERHARKAKKVVSMLSARNWHDTIMISRVGVRHMTSILLCKHAQSPIFFRLRRAEGSAPLRRSNLCLQSGLTP